MNHRIFVLCAAMGLTGLVTLGAPIDGKWTVQIQGQNGTQTQTVTLKADGAKLTGTLDNGRGSPAEISEGKIDGMDVSFKAARAGRRGNSTTDYTGKLMGDELKLTATREGATNGKGGGPQDFDFKRAK
jgi:hypothetical protein